MQIIVELWGTLIVKSMKISGKEGEEIATKYLESKGYQILARNYRMGHQEIDIIAQVQGIYVFVEVKSRSSSDFGFPEDFLSPQQEGRVRDASIHYLSEQNINAKDLRFDIISILISGQNIDIEHFEDAF
jgi:putative endonuclease